MSDVALFVLIFGGLLLLRIVLATVFFALMLPRGDRCPMCDTPTLHLQSALFKHWLPWFRRSWCLTCGWRGVLRHGAPSEQPADIAMPVRR